MCRQARREHVLLCWLQEICVILYAKPQNPSKFYVKRERVTNVMYPTTCEQWCNNLQFHYYFFLCFLPRFIKALCIQISRRTEHCAVLRYGDVSRIVVNRTRIQHSMLSSGRFRAILQSCKRGIKRRDVSEEARLLFVPQVGQNAAEFPRTWLSDKIAIIRRARRAPIISLNVNHLTIAMSRYSDFLNFMFINAPLKIVQKVI